MNQNHQKFQKYALRLISFILALSLISCGGGGSDDEGEGNTQFFSIGGTITGLQCSIILQNGVNLITLDSTTSFAIASNVSDGTSYNITVQTQPIGQTCTVSNASGIVSGANISNISVNCSTTSTGDFSVGGTVSGLTGSLKILNNENQTSELTITDNGCYVFAEKYNSGELYNVRVSQNPVGQICSISNTSGQINSGNISNADIFCSSDSTTVTVSGSFRAAPLTQIDSDINDPLAAANISNNVTADAQAIPNFSSVQGFLTLNGTDRTAEQDRLANTADDIDIFIATLQQNQTLGLQVVDFAGGDVFEGDLDLELYDLNLNLIGESFTTTEFEALTVPADGEYYIVVYPFSGSSKYTLSLGNVSPQAAALSRAGSMDFRPGEAIIQFKPNTPVNQFKANNQFIHLSHSETSRASLGRFDMVGQDTLSMASSSGQNGFFNELAANNPESYKKRQTLQQIKRLRQRADVKYAEPNYIYQAFKVPDDSAYSFQWHYPAISLPQAWDITTGSGVDTDVIVAVIDTGVYLAHPDFNGQLVSGYDFISDATNSGDNESAGISGDIDNNPDDPGDSAQLNSSSWHGSHVSGTVAAKSNDNNGVAGVAWDARVMPIRVLGKQGGSSYDIIQGVRFAAGLSNDSGTVPAQKADIINLSLGGGGYSQASQDAYTAARNAGTIIVAAAGNENSAQLSYPASYDGVVSVSATDFANERAPYSNFGTRIDVAAPGGNTGADLNNDGYADGVLSVIADDSTGDRKPSLKFMQGTSMASPHIAGVFALMRAVYPGITPAEIDNLLSSGAITTDLGGAGRDDIYGHGLIDSLKAVQEAQKLANGGTAPTQPALITSTPNQLTLGLNNSAILTLSNQGTEIASITSFSDDASWLTVTADTLDANNLGSYQVTVNRNGLSDSSYLGNITFNLSTGNSLRVQVSMVVGTVHNQGNAGTNYILLLDADLNAIDQVSPVDQGNGIFAFSFSNVASGSYTIAGGSDIDNDGLLCQLAEMCGGYPTINNLGVIEVTNTSLTGLDFIIDILTNFGVGTQSGDGSTIRPEGFRRLPLNNKQLQQ